MTEEEKAKIINKIKDHIHKDKVGYCGVLWASKQVFGENFSPTKDEIKIISSNITKNGKYLKQITEKGSFYDTEISENPNSNWLTQNPIKSEIFRLFAAIVVAYFTFLFSTCHTTNSEKSMSQDKSLLNTQSIESKPDPKEVRENLTNE